MFCFFFFHVNFMNYKTFIVMFFFFFVYKFCHNYGFIFHKMKFVFSKKRFLFCQQQSGVGEIMVIFKKLWLYFYIIVVLSWTQKKLLAHWSKCFYKHVITAHWRILIFVFLFKNIVLLCSRGNATFSTMISFLCVNCCCFTWQEIPFFF